MTSYLFHELESQRPGVRKIEQWDFIFSVALDLLRKMCLYERVMVFPFENRFQLTHIFLLTTSYLFHNLDWQRLGVRKIQQCGSIFVVLLD